jgi:hypothetical protein
MIAEELLFDSAGNVDVEAMRDERETRNVPRNPPPPVAQPRWLDGKCIAQIAVSECINCRSWHVQAVMRFLIDSANRKNGACYPSNETIAAAVHCSERTVQRATRWWCGRAYKVNGEIIPFLSIAVKAGKDRTARKRATPIILAGCPSSPSPEIITIGSGLGGMRLRL